jgi:hypothetical protein
MAAGGGAVPEPTAAALAVIGTGLFSEPVARLRKPTWAWNWLAVHIALATLLVFLLAYHIFVAFWYE